MLSIVLWVGTYHQQMKLKYSFKIKITPSGPFRVEFWFDYKTTDIKSLKKKKGPTYKPLNKTTFLNNNKNRMIQIDHVPTVHSIVGIQHSLLAIIHEIFLDYSPCNYNHLYLSTAYLQPSMYSTITTARFIHKKQFHWTNLIMKRFTKKCGLYRNCNKSCEWFMQLMN